MSESRNSSESNDTSSKESDSSTRDIFESPTGDLKNLDGEFSAKSTNEQSENSTGESSKQSTSELVHSSVGDTGNNSTGESNITERSSSISDHSDSEMNKEFSIEKLKGGENFHDWAFAMESYMAMKGYANCIKAAEATPTTPIETDATKLAAAKGLLVLSVEARLFPHIRTCSTAVEVWRKIQNLFEDRGLTRRIGLLEKLITNKLDDCESMTSYIGNIMSTANKLSSIGFNVDDQWLISIMLVGLPSEYKPFIMSLEGNQATISADEVKSKLLDMDSGEKNSAFLMKGKSKKKKEVFQTQMFHVFFYRTFRAELSGPKKRRKKRQIRTKFWERIYCIVSDEWQQ